MALSPQQHAIVSAAVRDGQVRTEAPRDMARAARLNEYGLLSRDKKDGRLWYPTDKARGLDLTPAAGDSAVAEAAPVPAIVPAGHGSVPEIVSMLQTAARLFDDGDIRRAQVIADGAYDLSQAEARFAAKYAATKELVPKFRQLQGDALLLETRCKIEVAKAYDAARKAGEAAGPGRPKTLPDGKGFTVEEAGLTYKEIHEARKLAEAEEKSPGIAERAIAARIAQGLAPTRANLKASIGTRTATKEERGDNLYETGPEAMHVLLALEEFLPEVWEPACGKGAIVRMLEDAGYTVRISDLNDYGTITTDGVVQDVIDFRETVAGDGEVDIVTNPPYGDDMNGFVAHALRVHKPRKMALLLNINAYFGFDDPDRNFIMKTCPPARIIANARRLPMMHRDGWDGPKASSSMNTAWFIWERQADGGYGGQTIMDRVDWADFMPVAESEAA